jgi:hypothetical protein
MASLVSLSGVAVALVGLLGVAAPARLTHLLAEWPAWTRLSATVGLRLGFGIVFLAAASDCRVPALVRLVGVAEFVGVVVLLVLGSERLGRFVAWWLAKPHAFVRRWCAAALAFGVLLIYAGA